MLHPDTSRAMRIWLSENPYEFYGSYNDELSSTQIDHIIEGDIQAFNEDWFDYECSIAQYADFTDIADNFSKHFNLHSKMRSWPEDILDLFCENKLISTEDLLNTCISNSDTNIAVKPIKQSKNHIEFPHSFFPDDYNRYLNRYNKRYLGIESSWDAETCYTYDVLTILGQIDLKDWIKHGRAPDFIKFGPEDQVITHNFYNGSGGLGDITLTKSRKMRAEFRNDKTDSYGVQNVFGFISSVWKNDLNCIWT